jgi:cyclopropane-fatty-acyl-phospholipid synthase
MLFLTNRVKRDFLDTCARISQGQLRLRTPEGETFNFGQGTPSADMHIHDWSVVTAIAARGDIGLGENYVAGLWDTSSIEDLTIVALRNLDQFRDYAYAGFWNSLKFRVVNRLMRANTPRGASRNIRRHYDVGNEFYQLWLDESMTYSSALFSSETDDLAEGQAQKYNRILRRMQGEQFFGNRLRLGRFC